jgi:hypothetical protein
MNNRELLPDELLWADGGHASDVVLTALADGETAIVPPLVRTHVDGCTTCTAHLGHAALLSLHTGAQLARAKPLKDTSAERLPLPRLAIALGLAVALVGLLPSLLHGDATRWAVKDAPMFARAIGTLLRRLPEETSLVFMYGGSLVLVAMGFAIVRLLPKKEVSR